MRKRLKVVLVLVALASQARADFLFWLDSPTGRSNPHDPHNPNFKSSSPLPTPTSLPTPLPGVTARIIATGGTPQSGFLVMLGNSVTTTATSDASGLVNFPSASFPANLHVIIPAALGGAGGRVVSYLGVTYSPLDLEVVDFSTSVNVPLKFWVTRTAGTTFSKPCAVDGRGNFMGAGVTFGGTPVCNPPSPSSGLDSYTDHVGETINYSLVEYDCSWTPVAALFVPQFVVPAGGKSLSVQTAASGFSTSYCTSTPSNISPWSLMIFNGLCGNSPADRWNVNYQGFTNTASLILPWTYLPSFSHFELNVSGNHQYGSNDESNFNMSLRSTSPITVWNPAFPQPGRVTQVPSQVSQTMIIDRDPTMAPNFGKGEFRDYTSGFSWDIFVQCGTCPSTFTFNLPTLPAAATHVVNPGDQVYVYFEFYSGLPSLLWPQIAGSSLYPGFYDQISLSSDRMGSW